MDRRPAMKGVRAAAGRLRGLVTQTPLLPLDWEGRRIWVKAESLQQGGSFKLRGATNRLLLLSAAERARRPRHALRMVAGGESDDPTRPLSLA